MKVKKNKAVGIANPLSLDNGYLRPNLLVHLDRSEKSETYERVCLFELGAVFRSGKQR